MDATVSSLLPHPVDTVLARVMDPGFLEQRALAAGDRNVVVTTTGDAGGPRVIRIEHDVSRNLPGFMTKVFSPTNHMTDVQTWDTAGATKTSAWTVAIAGQRRVAISGRLSLLIGAGGGCEYREDLTVTVSIPLLGGRIEKYVLGETEAVVRRQLEFLRVELGGR